MNNPYMVQPAKPVEVVMIVDRSGSMALIKDDVIGGFNTFLKAQQDLPGEANLTLVLFDDRYEVPIENVSIQKVAPLNDATFVPRGSTALYDALNRALSALHARAPEKAIVAIVTDGQENASREATLAQVKELVTKAEARGWHVHYLAANQDAFAVSAQFGVVRNLNFTADSAGVTSAYADITRSATNYRSE